MLRKIIGILLIAMFFAVIVIAVASVGGWKVTLLALGSSIGLTALLVLGIFLLKK